MTLYLLYCFVVMVATHSVHSHHATGWPILNHFYQCTFGDRRRAQEDAGGGLVFWHPKGSVIRRNIEDFWKAEHSANGYDIVYTPHIANLNLWKTSGHNDFYRDGMFQQMEVENEEEEIGRVEARPLRNRAKKKTSKFWGFLCSFLSKHCIFNLFLVVVGTM